MKAEELRIGNLVNHFDQIIGVDGIDDLDVFNKDCGEIPLHSIQPIPLTEEWLLKFGANCIGAKGWNFISVNKADTSYIYFNPNGVGLAIDNGTTENAIEVEIKYVHQLQNLYFALTGEELTFKN